MNLNLFKGLLSVALFAALSTFLISCGDNEKLNCAKTAAEFTTVYSAYTQAVSSENCEALEDNFAKVKDLLNDGKECDYFVDMAEGQNFDSVDEYIEDLEAAHQDHVDDFGC